MKIIQINILKTNKSSGAFFSIILWKVLKVSFVRPNGLIYLC